MTGKDDDSILFYYHFAMTNNGVEQQEGYLLI